jgi:hypothetical protein
VKHQKKKIQMRKSIIYILLLSVMLIACTKNPTCPIRHFEGKPVQRIYPAKIVDLEEFGILRPAGLVKTDNNSFLIRDRQNENIFNLINLSTGKIARGINIGQGPGELIMPTNFQYRNGKMLTYDRKKIYEIILSSDSTLAVKELYEIDTDVPRLFMINHLDTTFMATGIFEDFWLAEMNKDGEILSTIDFPIFKETRRTPGIALSLLYISTYMANSPDNKRVVIATQSHGVISFLNRTESGIEEYKQLRYHAPNFIVQERGNIAYSRDNRIGFCSLDCADNYVFALYSGRTFSSHGMLNHRCEHLLVYDWEGNPIRRYVLDIPLTAFVYCKKTNSIYGLAEHPEGVLIQYQLSNITH